MSVDEEEDGRSTVGWLIVAVVVVMIWAVFSVPGLLHAYGPHLRTGDYASVAGAIVGQALVVTAVVWLALYFLFVRRRAAGRGGRYFAILFAVALATEGGVVALAKWAAEKDDAQGRVAKAEMIKAFAGVANPDTASVDMRIKATGDAGEMERISKSAAARTIAAARKYHATLAALDYPAFVAPAHLAADRGLVKTREKLKGARQAVRVLRADSQANLEVLQTEVRASKMSEGNKTQFEAGIARGAAKRRQMEERSLDCEDGIFVEFGAIADLLARPRGRWLVKGKTIVFSNDRDLASYRVHISTMRQLAQKERGLAANERSEIGHMQDETSRE
jgi:hypothetical protein